MTLEHHVTLPGTPAIPAAAATAAQPPRRAVSAQLAEPAADEIDLLDAASGAVAKRVGPVVGGLALLFLIIYWLRRR